jgi:hypothetical protein
MKKLEKVSTVIQEKLENTNCFIAVWEKIVCLICNKEVYQCKKEYICVTAMKLYTKGILVILKVN